MINTLNESLHFYYRNFICLEKEWESMFQNISTGKTYKPKGKTSLLLKMCFFHCRRASGFNRRVPIPDISRVIAMNKTPSSVFD